MLYTISRGREYKITNMVIRKYRKARISQMYDPNRIAALMGKNRFIGPAKTIPDTAADNNAISASPLRINGRREA